MSDRTLHGMLTKIAGEDVHDSPLGMQLDPISKFLWGCFLAVCLNVFRIGAAPFEIVFHKGPMGDRALFPFGPLTSMGTWLATWVLCFQAVDRSTPLLFWGVGAVIGGRTLWVTVVTFKRYWTDAPVVAPTFEMGSPRNWVIRLARGKLAYIPIIALVEPGIGLAFGIVIGWFDTTTGLFICLSAVAVTLKNMLAFIQYRDALLDRADAECFGKAQQEHASTKIGNGKSNGSVAQSPINVAR